MIFDDYDNAKQNAQEWADDDGYDRGILTSYAYSGNCKDDGFRVFMLPAKANRVGHELQCEVVMCSNTYKCQPGHGPCA